MVTEQNRAVVVETIRTIAGEVCRQQDIPQTALDPQTNRQPKHHNPRPFPCTEYILWGDQNEPRIFDFFLENNILTYLHRILLQPSNRSGEVAKQVRR